MIEQTKQRPSLSVLLAIRGLVPLEADCADKIIVDRKDKQVVKRYYQGNSDFSREIELPPNSVKPYEYEARRHELTYSKKQGRWVKPTQTQL